MRLCSRSWHSSNERLASWSMVWVSRTMEMAVRITSVTSEPMARTGENLARDGPLWCHGVHE